MCRNSREGFQVLALVYRDKSAYHHHLLIAVWFLPFVSPFFSLFVSPFFSVCFSNGFIGLCRDLVHLLFHSLCYTCGSQRFFPTVSFLP